MRGTAGSGSHSAPASGRRASEVASAGPAGQATQQSDALDTGFLAALSSAVRECAVAVDDDLRMLRWNAVFEERFGTFEPGAPLTDALRPDGLEELVGRVSASGKAEAAIELAEVNDDDDDDLIPTFLVSAVPILQSELGARVLLLIEDVTDRTEQRDRMVANSRMVSVGEMASGVAHELNNPLTAVLGFAQLALRQDLNDVLRRDLEAIATEAERAGRIVDNLLSFARSEGTGSMVFDAAASIQRILDLREYECRVNNIEVVTYFDPDTPKTKADGHRMEQVLLNLLGNSIAAIADGPGRGTVTVGLVAINGQLRISFTDDGPGIPDGVMPHIFDMFYTTKPVGKGTGLGLSICRTIVQDHGGDIRVESHPGRGTTFVVEFPIVEVPEPQEDELHQKAAPRSYTMLKVLAVDDEPIVTDLLAQALGGLGHDVDTSDDGAEALRMIHLADYDAIILDVKMPGLGGPEVYRCIEGLRPDLMDRVLFITGDTVSLDTASFMKEVQADVLLKPFSLDELKRHMEEFAAAKDARVAKRPSGGRPDLGAGLTRITHKGR